MLQIHRQSSFLTGTFSLPDEVAKGSIKEFEVTMAPVDHVKETIALYLGVASKEREARGRSLLDSDAIEKAVKNAFGTAANIDDTSCESIRKGP